MAKRIRKRKPKKPRCLEALSMILGRKGGPMKHRCEKRGGAKNVQRELLSDE